MKSSLILLAVCLAVALASPRLPKRSGQSVTSSDVFFKETPKDIYYIQRDRDVQIGCTAVNADLLKFRCGGQRMPNELVREKIKVTKEGQMKIVSKLTLPYSQVAEWYARNGFSRKFVCNCIAWYRNNNEWSSITSNSTHQGEPSGVVMLMSEALRNFPAVIPDGPQMVVDLQDTEIEAGSTANLSCSMVRASWITIMCGGYRFSSQDFADYGEKRAPDTNAKLNWATLELSSDEVQNYQGSDYTCQCSSWTWNTATENWETIEGRMARVEVVWN